MRWKKKYTVIAIDEAGRGPLAGPIAVAAISTKTETKPPFKRVETFNFQNKKLLKNIRDSKKLSDKQKAEWMRLLKDNFEYKVTMVGPRIIDRIGIQRATKLAVARILRRFSEKPDMVLLDGLMSAPKHYNQTTIIKGDERVPLISAASIVAKVYRDKKMRRLHKNFPGYRLDAHKGYGTKLHYKMIKKEGISDLHRRSFLKKLCEAKPKKD